MLFRHASAIWRDYPQLAVGALHVRGIHRQARVEAQAEPFLRQARLRLDSASESDLPEIQAWRRAFASMGVKPTQYRCASEALLRRLRKEGAMPPLHPLVELCNAASMAYAIPVAALDAQRLGSALEVRHADGTERYLTFGGDTEHPEPGKSSMPIPRAARTRAAGPIARAACRRCTTARARC